jgi:hypothetical protein
MSVLRIKNIILLSFVAASILFLRQPLFSQTTISEQTLTSDVIIDKMYQPGSGLPVGKIQSVRGEAIVFHHDPSVGYRIHPGQPLYAGDVMRTRETAWILCRLVDGSHIVLSPKTTLTILQSSYNSSRKRSVTALRLNHGSARFKLNPMPDLSSYDYKVQTQLAVTRAREADFVVQASSEATEIVAFENSRLEVTSMAQPEEVTFLSDFQRTIVSNAIISPTVETLSKEDIEIMMSGFRAALSGNLATAGTKKGQGPDFKTKDALIEEDIVED